MLQSIREMTKSWIVKSFMILLLSSFAVWGVGDMFKGNPQKREVADVGNISISVQNLILRFQSDLTNARRIYGSDFTEAQAKKIGLLDQALNTMVEEASFSQEVARLGVNVPDEIILKRIINEPRLKNEKGEFDKLKWQQALRHMRLSEESFVIKEKEQTARNLIFMSVLSNVKAPQIMVDYLYKARGAKRILDVIKLKNSSINGIASPSNSVLKSYYEDNKSNYVAPEYRGITVAELSISSVEKDIKITDSDLEKAYKERAKELKEPETRDITQLVLQDKNKADKIYNLSKKTKSLSKAAKTENLTSISINGIKKLTVLPELRDELFSLKNMEISKPIKTSLGWHVMQIKKIHKGGLPTLNKIKKALRKRLKEERAGDNLASLVNQWDDELAAGQSLEDIADMLKLRLTRVATIDNKGRDLDGKEIKDIPSKEIILQSSFELNNSETGAVLEDGKGNYYVVRVDNIILSQPRPFNEVKNKVKSEWIEQKQSEIAKVKIRKIEKEIKDGKAPSKFASQRGITVRVSKPISLLGDMDKNIPVTAMNKIFEMKKGDVITVSDAGNNYVLKMNDIVSVNTKKPSSSKLKVVENLKSHLPSNYVDEYALYLRELFPRHINSDLLKQLKYDDSSM